MNDDEPFERANAAAMRFLTYRPRSASEVRSHLQRRYPAHVIEQVVESLIRDHHLDDVKFADLWRYSRDSFKPRSAAAIRRELISKGIARDIADAAVSDVDDQDSAYRAGLKLARRLDHDDAPKFQRRLWGYLKRRGFADSVVRNTIARLRDEGQDSPGQARHVVESS